MFNKTYNVTVRELMTTELKYIEPEKSVAEAFEWISNEGYTAVPLKKESAPYYFITDEQIESKKDSGHGSASIHEYAQRIDLDRLISPDTEFKRLLESLYDELFYFIGWNDDIEGIITIADLNKPPVYAFLYTKIYQAESHLRDIVDENVTDTFIEENTKYAMKNYKKHGTADLQLRLVDYTNFGDLERMIKNHDSAWEGLSFEQKGETIRVLGEIRKVRNEIAHYGNVIDVMRIDPGSKDRDVRDLKGIYEGIERIINN